MTERSGLDTASPAGGLDSARVGEPGRPEMAPYESYLSVVLELLSREDCRQSVVDSPLVLETLAQRVNDVKFLDLAVRRLADFYRESELPGVRKLLFDLIYEVQDDDILVRLVKDHVETIGGTSLVRRCLAGFRRKDPRRVFSVISTILRSEDSESLAELAKVTALALSEDAGMLYLWASEESQSLLEPKTLEGVLAQAGAQTVSAAFKKLFTSLSTSDAKMFLRAIPAGVLGAEQILFEALDFAATDVRLMAIERLVEFPTHVTIATLKGILDHINDSTERFNPLEAEATLKALSGFDRDDVQEYLDVVRTQRNILGYRYRKGIRKILESLLEEVSIQA